MKRFLVIAHCAIVIASTACIKATAQPMQVQTIEAKGSFNNGGSAARTKYKITDMPLVTTSRTVTLSTADTLTEQLYGVYNGSTWVFTVDSVAGRVDSVTITFQGSVDSGTAVDYATVQTFTCANQAKNAFYYSFTGNPFKSYRALLKTTNKAAGSNARIKGKLLVRYKDEEWWEDNGEMAQWLNGSIPL